MIARKTPQPKLQQHGPQHKCNLCNGIIPPIHQRPSKSKSKQVAGPVLNNVVFMCAKSVQYQKVVWVVKLHRSISEPAASMWGWSFRPCAAMCWSAYRPGGRSKRLMRKRHRLDDTAGRRIRMRLDPHAVKLKR
jgi:hypothetical protein